MTSLCPEEGVTAHCKSFFGGAMWVNIYLKFLFQVRHLIDQPYINGSILMSGLEYGRRI